MNTRAKRGGFSRGTALTVTAFAFCYLVLLVHVAYLGVVAEDAYISFRFAKNLAAGNGLVWNVGEPPIEGYTNFLWVLMAAAGMALGLDVERLAPAMGVAASLAALAYAYFFVRKLLGGGRISSLVPCALLAVAGPFATWAGSGMETNLFALLLLATCYHGAAHWQSGSKLHLIVSFLLCFLATLTRPEGLGVFVVVLGVHSTVAILRKDRGALLRLLRVSLVAYGTCFLAYLLWRLSFFDQLLPNTFYAKTGGSIAQSYRGAMYVLYFSFHFLLPLLPLGLLAASEASDPRRVRSRDLMESIARQPGRWAGNLLCLSVFVSYTLYIALVGGDYMAMYRFFVPVLPLAYILFARASGVLFDGPAVPPTRRLLGGLCVVIALVGTLMHSTPAEQRLWTKSRITHGQFRGVQTERWHSRRLALIGRFLNEYKSSADESVAAKGIGAVSYFA
ncbi:MAG: hypothetical protein OEQ13_07680, partial [Acidobacteriota bacterium]|nr:hypothetical protein [Acidobacteriota bacterium]